MAHLVLPRRRPRGHIGLYLELAGESTDVHAELQFILVPHGQLTRAQHGGRTGGGRRTFVSKYTDNCFGSMDFMAREELEMSEYLKDDCFCLRCNITTLNKPVVKLHDTETLQLLCYCNDDLCENIHAPDKMKVETCPTSQPPPPSRAKEDASFVPSHSSQIIATLLEIHDLTFL